MVTLNNLNDNQSVSGIANHIKMIMNRHRHNKVTSAAAATGGDHHTQQRPKQRRLLTIPMALVVSAVLASAQVSAHDIRLTEIDGTRMYATSDQNYAISSPSFARIGWRCISVNGNQATIVSTDNNLSEISVGDMSKEQGDAINQARALMMRTFMFGPWGSPQIHAVGPVHNGRASIFTAGGMASSIGGTSSGSGSTDYISSGGTSSSSGGMISSSTSGISSSGGGGINVISTNSASGGSTSSDWNFNLNENGRSISASTRDNFSIARPNLPFNWMRVFINDDLITTVNQDQTVLMRPLSSLSEPEREQVQELKAEVEQARQEFRKRMNAFQENMQHFGQNLQQSIQQSLGGIFSNLMPNTMPGGAPMFGAGGGPPGPFGTGAMAGAGAGGAMAGAGAMAGSLPMMMTPNGPNNPQSFVQSMFGDSFPFGPRNSPFGAGGVFTAVG